MRSAGAPGLADELVHPGLVDRAVAVGVDVDAVVVAGRPAVQAHGDGDRLAVAGRREDEVDVAGQEAERDPAAGGAQHRRLLVDLPVARERPLVARQGLAGIDAPGPAPGPHVGLARAQGVPVGGQSDARGVHGGAVVAHAQRLLDRLLGLAVVALAEVVEDDLTLAVDEVHGGPVLVAQRLPDRELVVEHDRVGHVQRASAWRTLAT